MSERSMYTILLVDDNPHNLFALRTLLEKSLDVTVIEATSGAETLELVSEHKIDLILLDVKMPDLNGFEVAEYIRHRKKYQHIPIIFLTAFYKSEEFKWRALEGGAIDYLTKPIDDTILLNRVRAYLRVIAGEREINLELERINTQLKHEIEQRRRVEDLLRQSEEQLEIFFSESLDGCFFMMLDQPVQWDAALNKDDILDYVFTHERLTKVNYAILSQYAGTRDQLLGCTPSDLFAHDVASGRAVWRQLFDQGRTSLEALERKFDGTEMWVEGSYICLYDPQGRIRGHFGIQRDITSRKEAEKALQTLNEELERKVEERTAELKRSNSALEESIETLKKAQEQLIQSEKMAALGGLVAGVSHEISTPIGIGVTAASNLEQKTLELQQAYQQNVMKRSDLEKYFEHVLESSKIVLRNLQHAADQIRGFKQVAVDQTSEEKRRFHLKTYLEEILMSLYPKLKKTRHTVTIQCPDDIFLDSYPGAFSQIMTNLIMNSLIHGFEHLKEGKILCDVTTDGAMLIIRYHDNGKGIPAEEQEKIFEPFYTTKRNQGGSGLGLNIILNLVTHRLNGKIVCASEPGVGTTFTMTIPKE